MRKKGNIILLGLDILILFGVFFFFFLYKGLGFLVSLMGFVMLV